MEGNSVPRRLTAAEFVALRRDMREALQTMRIELDTPSHHSHRLGSDTMNIERQRLIERLLAADVQVRFISVAEAMTVATQVCGQRPPRSDAMALEAALHAPMYMFLDGKESSSVLAEGLAVAVKAHQPFPERNADIAAELAALFRIKNGFVA